ncbi:MAG: dephospho-CoA kinase [Gemmatimonadetes bacterium]|nr:dephospho-CoA kinase [Gemmatimonadota bacterium]
MSAEVVALTGGFGSGKSTACEELRALGCAVIDADKLAREAVAPGTDGLARAVAILGEKALQEDGSLDRERVAEIVFADPGAKHALESIIHPYVGQRMAAHLNALMASGKHEIIVLDIPLLFESGREGDYPRIVVVDCPRELRIRRLVKGRGFTEAEVEARIAAQILLQEKVTRAQHVIDNSGSRRDLRAEVARFVRTILDPNDRPV